MVLSGERGSPVRRQAVKGNGWEASDGPLLAKLDGRGA
jgi:hypothetical protein